MKKLSYFLLPLLLVLFMACDKEDIQLADNDYLIFGHIYGLCMGEECVEIFKITDEQLLEDQEDSYEAESFDFVPLSNELFEQVRDLRDIFPTELLNNDSTYIGCPDCLDQGGIFVEYPNTEGDSRRWFIDQDQRNVPEFLHSFMDSVNAKIALINQ